MSDKTPRGDVKYVAEYYAQNKWTVITAPKGSLVDLIASKGSRMHFVKVLSTSGTSYSEGVAKNDYIQNAFSNMAIPVFATEISESPRVYKYVNINTETYVSVRASQSKTHHNTLSKK